MNFKEFVLQWNTVSEFRIKVVHANGLNIRCNEYKTDPSWDFVELFTGNHIFITDVYFINITNVGVW